MAIGHDFFLTAFFLGTVFFLETGDFRGMGFLFGAGGISVTKIQLWTYL